MENGRYEMQADKSDYLYFVRHEGNNCRVHFHRSMEFVVVTEGRYKICINGRAEMVPAGCIAVSNGYDAHYYAEEEPSSIYIVLISDSYLTAYAQRCGGIFDNFLLDPLKNEEAVQIVTQWFKRYPTANKLINQGFVDLFLGSIAQNYPTDQKRANGNAGTAIRMLQYLEENFTRNVTLEELASYLGYSRIYCSKLFHRIAGADIRNYLNSLRVEKARELLNSSGEREKTVLQIALSSGFESLNTFYRVYKKEIGDLPIRRMNKKDNI